MRRGDLYWADLAPRSGSEQQGRRPVVIVSSDALNDVPGWRSIVIVPLSRSPRQARRGPSAVPIPSGTTGLREPGVALCHQITTLDRAKFTRRIGALARADLDRVALGIRVALDLV